MDDENDDGEFSDKTWMRIFGVILAFIGVAVVIFGSIADLRDVVKIGMGRSSGGVILLVACAWGTTAAAASRVAGVTVTAIMLRAALGRTNRTLG